MAITRKLLKGMGLTEEQADTIIEGHTETVDALKEQIATYKADADKLPGVQKELDALKAAGNDGWEERYNSVKKDFDDYKAEQAAKETHRAKETAYRALLKNAGITERRIDTVLKVSDIDAIELDSKGAIKGADKLTESVKTEWADFIATSETKGAETSTPPTNGGKTMTKDEIMAIADRGERRQAIAANLDLFKGAN
ncbi:MAG: phage scaffolding protein [Oscillospiraceae bacterium]|nr:phage scaffolding protein [Oscillospiraceae bacterium]